MATNNQKIMPFRAGKARQQKLTQVAPQTAQHSTMTITQVSQATNIPSSALRYYESIGLLSSAGRTKAGYRLYPGGTPERIRMLRAAQAAGLTLDDIRTLLESAASTGVSCPSARRLLSVRLQQVRARLRELKRIECSLVAALASCAGTTTKDVCTSFCSV